MDKIRHKTKLAFADQTYRLQAKANRILFY